jgi:hypothetical protein
MFGLLFFVPLLGMAVGVPTNTVKTYVRSIYNKLGISSRRTAVLAGYENGLIATTPPQGPGTRSRCPVDACPSPRHIGSGRSAVIRFGRGDDRPPGRSWPGKNYPT